jgi:CheY-like chemotaxis protein
LFVTDQGVGVPKEILPKIFDPYVSTKQRGHQKGMGLGLTICHSVIQRHGGAITVESTVGQGTTFKIHLPASSRAARPDDKLPPKEHPRRGRLLVMDDDDGVRQTLGVLLRWMGYEVELCTDGGQAVEAYEKGRMSGHPFDAVFLDLTVRGGMGGLEAVQLLRKTDPEVRAVVISGHTRDTGIVDFEKNGFRAALPKPFDERELRRLLTRVMGN